MKRVTPEEFQESGDLHFEFFRSSGPGGQNVNKVSTAVRLRLDVRNTRLIPEEVKSRLSGLAGRRMSTAGVLVIESRRYRTQSRNREDAVKRLMDLVRKAWQKPNVRRPTKPSVESGKRRLEEKRRRSAVKRERGRPDFSSE